MSVSAPQPQQQATATGHFPDLLSLGIDIHSDLSAYASGLSRAGAPAPAVQRVMQMAGVIAELNGILQHEAPIPNPAHNPQQGQPQGQPPPAPQQGGPGNAHPALVSAVQSLAKALPNPSQQ